MSSAPISTLIRMMEVLPEDDQNQVVEHLRDYIAEMQDEEKWDRAFGRTQGALTEAARLAKQQIAAGKAEPFDETRL